jgi:hypothetical protein
VRLGWIPLRSLLLVALLALPSLVAPHSALAEATIHSASAAPADSKKSVGSKFLDPEDGWFDMSEFLTMRGGFIPLVVPVTEPAVGYGAGGGLIFIKENPPLPGGGYRKPNMFVVGGMGTNDGTWAGFAAHTGSWLDDRLQTVVAGLYGSVDLDFFGIGEGPLNDQPIGYDLEPAGGLVQAKYRIGRSPVQVGFGYGMAAFDVTFDADSIPAQVGSDELDERVGGVLPALVYDTRDNLFTPLGGVYGSLETGLFREWLGGTSDFERVRVMAIVYRPVSRTLFLGVRGLVASSFGDVPFYARPYVSLRGAPVMQYFGESAGSVEIEARWQLWKRFSAVGFTGVGTAWNELDSFGAAQDVLTGGGGIRYEIARRQGIHMGLDVAWGPDETALYVQFGGAWFRP